MNDFDQLFALLIATIGVCTFAVLWQMIRIENAIRDLRK